MAKKAKSKGKKSCFKNPKRTGKRQCRCRNKKGQFSKRCS